MLDMKNRLNQTHLSMAWPPMRIAGLFMFRTVAAAAASPFAKCPISVDSLPTSEVAYKSKVQQQ
jgi:hypothetical protein